MTETTTETAHRDGVIAGLRELADALEDHPRMPLPGGTETWSNLMGFASSQAETREVDGEFVTETSLEFMARLAKNCPGKLEKVPLGNYFGLQRKFGTITVVWNADRDQVCIQKKTGTETRKVETVVTPAVTAEHEETVDVFEWECLPLLGRAA